jgi:hypothetical protein
MARNYKDWLNAYLEYSSSSEAPEKMHFWTGVSVIAGALRRKIWLDMKYFQWTPNMYIVFVAPPGIVSKSTTASIGMNLLKQVEGINFGPDAVTWQALIQELQAAKEMFQLRDGDELYYTMSALTISSSEFGTFLNPSDREMVDALVSLWDGQVGAWSKVTKTQGNDVIENPWINVLACTTPDWIAGNFPDYMIGGGFTSRTVFVYADKKRRLVAYPDEEVSKEFDNMEKLLIQDLGHISNVIAGPYKLTPEARAYGKEWYQYHYDNIPAHLSGERFGGYIARKQTHIHKLALVIAASQRDQCILEKDDLYKASLIIDSLEPDMPKVFNRIGVAVEQRDVRTLIHFVQAKKEVTNVELYQRAFNTMSYKEFQAAMDGALAAGWVKRVQVGNDVVWRVGNVHCD